jgi:phage terminase large subunit-like protein
MASSRQRKGSGRSTSSGPIAKPLRPWTLDHFRRWTEYLVWEGNQHHALAEFQYDIFADIVAGFREIWQIIPEGNGKSTFSGILALYGADFSDSPWIPVGAASAKQARIVYQQAEGFVERTPDLQGRFRCFGGYKLIRSLANGGVGIEVFAHDPKTGDGVIPYPFAIVDELHRHDDLRLYGLWKGKLRKRGAQILTISTAGEPETPFEVTRDKIRRKATKRHRDGSYLRAEGPGLVLHEWMVPKDELCSDMAAVAAANPLSGITAETLAEDFESPTLDLGDWKRLKCNRPTRSVATAVTDKEWDDAEVDAEIPHGSEIAIGLDVAFKWDTTAFVPLWKGPEYRLLGAPKILVPPRDGSSLHPDEIKQAFLELAEGYRVDTLVMDMDRSHDFATWFEDQGVTVIDHGSMSPKTAVADYEAFMEGLRNGTLKHTGDPGLRAHVLNAIARRLPGGEYRFDRPSQVRQNARAQDRRVIDALDAASMVVEFSTRDTEPTQSVYEERFATA